MAWGEEFKRALMAKSQVYNWKLRFLGQTGDYLVGTQGEISQSGTLRISDQGPQISGSRVIPQRWNITIGGFTVPIVGDIRRARNEMLRKGAIAELICSINGCRAERVTFGQLRSLSGARGRWTLEFTDVIGMLSTRLSTRRNELNFFYNAGKTTEITSNHTASDTNLFVSDVTIFDKDTNEDGLVKIIDDTNSRIDYWSWSSKVITSGSAGYLVITGHGQWPQQLSGAYNSVPSGETAMSVARLRGLPNHEFLRMFFSTGRFSQGPSDDFPKSWGAGYHFNQNIIDYNDLNLQQQIFDTSSGQYEIQILFETPAQNGIRELLSKLSQIGQWPVLRQGSLSWRVCQDPKSAPIIAADIFERDIISIVNHEIYSRDCNVVYSSTEIIGGVQKSSASDPDETTRATLLQNNVETFPANNKIERDNRFIYRYDNPLQSGKASADVARMKVWDFNTWESLSIDVIPKFASLCSGDIVQITSRFLIGFSEGRGEFFDRRRGMDTGVEWRPGASICNLTIAILPK